MYLDKDAILNSLTKEDIIKIVTYFGSSYPKTDSNGDLIFQSVCHGIRFVEIVLLSRTKRG